VTAPLVQRLSLVVDAATGGTEARMDAVASASRDMGAAAQQSAGQVAAAAERVALAQLKRDDATDRVALSERRLLEVQERYAAGSSQVLAAEQRLEASRRGLHVATRNLETAQEQSTRAQRDAVEATGRLATEQERARVGSGRLQGQLDSLKGAAAGVVAFGLGDWARDQLTGYLDGARGAQTLATSMNATIEQGGRLTQLFSNLGLEADDLLEIQAEFATKIGDGGRNLEQFGAAVHTNADGTTNWALTLEDALVNLQKIPDATERNATGFRLFGEEGYKQLSRLLSSGMSVEDAMDAIGTPFSAEDVRTAQEYDRAMMELNLESGQLGRTLAREVVPAAAGLVGGLGDVVGVVTSIPLPLSLATAAAITMGRTGFDPLAKAGEFVRDRVDGVRTAVSNATAQLDADAGRMARAGGVIRSGLGGAVGALGGPIGVAAIGIGIVAAVAQDSANRVQRNVDEAVEKLTEAEARLGSMAMTSGEAAQQLANDAGLIDRYTVSWGGARNAIDEYGGTVAFADDVTGGMLSTVFGLSGALSGTESTASAYEQKIEAAREELGLFGAQQLATQLTSRSLTDLIAEGTTTGEEFAEAVQTAAEAQAEQERTASTATAALAAYHAVTDQAVESTLALIEATYGTENAHMTYLSAVDAAKGATDDSTTSLDEARQAQIRVMEAALAAGDAAADAAVAQATAAGTIVTPLDEARVRADALITDLQSRLNTPGLTESAQLEMQGLIDKLTTARDNGDVNALVTLTGADEAAGELDAATEDREAHVNVESRGGPAVDTYLDGLAEDRLAIIRTESRGGPAVDTYLDGLTLERLALIRVESRNGPAVDGYLDGLAVERLAIIRVETRGGPDVDRYLDDLAGRRRTAVIDVQSRGTGAGGGGGGTGAGMFGAAPVSIGQLIVQPQVDSGGRLTAQAQQVTGRQVVSAIREYERRNGPGWRT
jgi:hypothetical protein